jgi:hypothetical protein
VGETERFVKLLRTENKLRLHIKSQVIARLVSKILDFGIKIFSREAGFKNKLSLSVETPDCFDERYDELWSKSASQFKIIGVRSSTHLNWRYVDFPGRPHYIFSLVNSNREVSGYLVYYIEKEVCYIVDMFFADFHVLDALLCGIIKYCRKNGFISISVLYMGSDSITERFKKWGFHLRQSGSKVLVYCGKDHPFGKILYDKNCWHILEGDNDI